MLKMIFRIDFLASTRASPISSHPIVAPYCTQQFELMYSRALEPRQRRCTLLSHPIVAPYCTQYCRTLLSHPIVPNIVAPYCRTLLYPILSHPIVAPYVPNIVAPYCRTPFYQTIRVDLLVSTRASPILGTMGCDNRVRHANAHTLPRTHTHL